MPHRFEQPTELEFEVDPEVVWDAISTGPGRKLAGESRRTKAVPRSRKVSSVRYIGWKRAPSATTIGPNGTKPMWRYRRSCRSVPEISANPPG